MDYNTSLIAYSIAYLSIVVFLVFSCIYTCALIVSALYQAPFVGSRKKLLRDIFKTISELSAKQTPKQTGQLTFMDLGAGDGRVVFEAADKYGFQAIGYERNPLLVWLSNITKARKKSQAQFVQASIFDAPLEKADIIYCFLLPVLLNKLAPLLKKKCKKGTLVVSHGFRIQALKPYLFHTISAEPFDTYFYRL